MVKDHEEETETWGEVVVAPVASAVKKTTTSDKKTYTRGDKIEEMMATLTTAMDEVYHGKFDVAKTERMAALSLSAQMELAKLLADAEWRAKQAKQEVKYISAEAHGKYKAMPSDKKLTDAGLEQLVNRDQDVRAAESSLAELEREVKEWQYVHGTLRDAHIFFRSLGRYTA